MGIIAILQPKIVQLVQAAISKQETFLQQQDQSKFDAIRLEQQRIEEERLRQEQLLIQQQQNQVIDSTSVSLGSAQQGSTSSNLSTLFGLGHEVSITQNGVTHTDHKF